ncbi:hypothetical protein C1H46_028075 [Malus baccata]|uniref:U1-type domain-containing protein n=1 Tax=Malus baccata TaxID=106549 RepID=A0A540LIU1_MALBA|nr:hypothetical protein C1H46_028075 [Malus baccata]
MLFTATHDISEGKQCLGQDFGNNTLAWRFQFHPTSLEEALLFLPLSFHISSSFFECYLGFSIPSNGTEHYASANPNAASWSNTSARPAGNATPRPSGNGTPKLHCEICNIYCDTKDVLNKHKQGKKHKMNLDKLKGKKIPGENSKRRAADQPPEDLETKRRKVLESGAAPDALRTCALCNVVCLTETDFNNHRSGQRHVEAATAARRHGAGTSGASSHWQSQWRYQDWNS